MDELRSEAEKWLKRMKELLPRIKPKDERGKAFLANIKAYVSDAEHFLEKGDLVRAFESVIWSYAIFETCKELGVLND